MEFCFFRRIYQTDSRSKFCLRQMRGKYTVLTTSYTECGPVDRIEDFNSVNVIDMIRCLANTGFS